jgi:hypothetical protein
MNMSVKIESVPLNFHIALAELVKRYISHDSRNLLQGSCFSYIQSVWFWMLPGLFCLLNARRVR